MRRYWQGILAIVILMLAAGCGDKEESQSAYPFLDREALAEGVFKGFDIETGMTFDEIEQRFGQPIETDYLQGGKYSAFDHEEYQILLFDADERTVKHIMLYPKKEIDLSTVRSLLGKADFDGVPDLYEAWELYYSFGEYSFFVDGATDKRDGQVQRFFLKYEQ